jgi:uncharacterized protein YggL (DUF469 family)
MTEQKRGRGRPKMAPGEAKTFIFSVRLSVDERSLIEKKAEAEGFNSASDWAREVLLAEVQKS